VVVSIIIPTLNRADILRITLEALGEQSLFVQGGRSLPDLEANPAYPAEVLVVDDGSVDHTRTVVEAMQGEYPVPLRYFLHPRKKAGAARNFGVRQACGRLLVFLGDDTVPAPDFLEQHLKAHRERASRDNPERVVVIGYTPWSPSIRRTRFLEYIGEWGWQFGFSLITDPENVPFNFFYTSNLSMDRGFFLHNGGFDEEFPECNWEDIELGLRLKDEGMKLVYAPEAVAHHLHPTSLTSFIRRQRKVGRSAWTFYERQPRMGSFLGLPELPKYSLPYRLKLNLLTGLCILSEKLPWPDLSRYYPDLMSYHYRAGISEARSRSAADSGGRQRERRI
jgi:GT2 family glycosyltransferase